MGVIEFRKGKKKMKRLVSVMLSVGFVLGMTPFGTSRVLADDLPQENPIVLEVPAEDQDVPEEKVEVPAEEVPGEEVPAEEVPAEVPEEKVGDPVEEVPGEEVPVEEIPEDHKKEVPSEEVPAEEVPAEKVPAEENKQEELLAEAPEDEKADEEEEEEKEEEDEPVEAKVLPTVSGFTWKPSRTNGHMDASWSLSSDFIDEYKNYFDAPDVKLLVTVYREGTVVGTRELEVSESYTYDFTSEGLIPLDGSSAYSVTLQLKAGENEDKYTDGEVYKSEEIVPSKYTTRYLNVSFVPVLENDNDIVFNFEWTGLYGDADTMCVTFYINDKLVRENYYWDGINTITGKRDNFYRIGTKKNQMAGHIIHAGDKIDVYIWMAASTTATTKYCETHLSTTVYKAQDLTATFDTQGIGSLSNNTVTVHMGENVEFDEKPAADGYIFRGWSKTKKAVGEYDFEADAFNLPGQIYEDTTLYAMWERVYHKVTFDPNGGEGTKEILCPKGESIKLPENPFKAPVGKEFDKWEIGNPGDTLTPTGDITVKTIWKDIPVEYTSKASVDWKRGSKSAATVTVNRNFSDEKTSELFKNIELDGAVVDASNYTTEKGSLIVNFKPEYLETLSDGKHTFKIVFEDGSCNVTVNIITVKKVDSNPKTGDMSASDAMLALMLLAAAGVSVTAVLKKKREED